MDELITKIAPILSGLPLHTLLLLAVIVLWRKLNAFQDTTQKQASEVAKTLQEYADCVETVSGLKREIEALQRQIDIIRPLPPKPPPE